MPDVIAVLTTSVKPLSSNSENISKKSFFFLINYTFFYFFIFIFFYFLNAVSYQKKKCRIMSKNLPNKQEKTDIPKSLSLLSYLLYCGGQELSLP